MISNEWLVSIGDTVYVDLFCIQNNLQAVPTNQQCVSAESAPLISELTLSFEVAFGGRSEFAERTEQTQILKGAF